MIPGDQPFLAAVAACPADDTPRLVFADWLDDRGTDSAAAWADLIRTQCHLDDPAALNRMCVDMEPGGLACGGCGPCKARQHEAVLVGLVTAYGLFPPGLGYDRGFPWSVRAQLAYAAGILAELFARGYPPALIESVREPEMQPFPQRRRRVVWFLAELEPVNREVVTTERAWVPRALGSYLDPGLWVRHPNMDPAVYLDQAVYRSRKAAEADLTRAVVRFVRAASCGEADVTRLAWRWRYDLNWVLGRLGPLVSLLEGSTVRVPSNPDALTALVTGDPAAADARGTVRLCDRCGREVRPGRPHTTCRRPPTG
jgi:uncharacterized protein (TIGR02996 family)